MIVLFGRPPPARAARAEAEPLTSTHNFIIVPGRASLGSLRGMMFVDCAATARAVGSATPVSSASAAFGLRAGLSLRAGAGFGFCTADSRAEESVRERGWKVLFEG